MVAQRQPTMFIPHGGGPCFFMDDPMGAWTSMRQFLEALPASLPAPPTAILLISGHWETKGFAFTSAAQPPLLFDYYGFPPHTYALRYDSPGSPHLAGRAARLLQDAGIEAWVDGERGLDHGVFIPLKVAWPDAEVPVVQMSVERSLDPALHLAAGRALAPLRDQGVLILGSGMSFHNMRAYGNPAAVAPSAEFDAWLTRAAAASPPEREAALAGWEAAPFARFAHPREEHLIPLMVAAGASQEPGERTYNDEVMHGMISGFRFD